MSKAHTHDDENVPGSAAILAAVDRNMQAGMPALPGATLGAGGLVKMKTAICVSVMLLMTWFISVASGTADRHFDKARELLNNGRYREAADEFSAIAKLSSSGSEVEQNARYWVGQCYFRMGQFDEALSTFEKLIQDYPESSITPVTQLMIARVEQEKENEKLRAKISNTSDEGVIIDPKTGLKYTRIRTYTGKNDVIKEIQRWTSLSPNGRFLLLGKFVIPLDGGEPFDLVDMPASRGIWSPDGKKVAFYSGGATWVVPVSPETGRVTGIARKLLNGKHGVRPNWSPDSEKLALVRTDREAQRDIWTLSVKDGALLQLTDDPVMEYYQAWSPDGKTIAYLAVNPGETGGSICVIPAEGGVPRKISDVGEPIFWSPDSRWLVYALGTELRFLCLDDNREIGITPPKAVGRFPISWLHDRNKMIFYRPSYDYRSTVKVVSVSGGPSFELGRSLTFWGGEQFWSPDSKMIITGGESKDGDRVFWIIPLGGGDPVPLKLEVSVPGKPVPGSLSPDRSKVLFTVRRSDGTEDLWVAPVSLDDGRTTGPAVIVFRGWNAGYRWIGMYSWSPDGSKIAVYKEGIWIASAEGGNPVQITKAQTRPHRVQQSWSPDGRMISYLSDSSGKIDLYVIPASGGEATKILVGIHRLWYAWSPDSKEIAAISEEGQQLLAVSIDGGTRRIMDLNELPLDAWDICWSHDGQSIIFVGWKAEDEPNQMFMVPAEGGKAIELAVGDKSDLLYGISLSPDAKWISYTSEGYVKTRSEGSIWEVDVSELLSGEEKKQ
jgi:Tol biopolymer transport system component